MKEVHHYIILLISTMNNGIEGLRNCLKVLQLIKEEVKIKYKQPVRLTCY